MIELKLLNPHWLEDTEDSDYDLCVHSAVWLKIGDTIFSNEKPDDWAVSATAYHFLRTLKRNHNLQEDEQLIPHCSFNFWKGEDKITFVNCSIGINWDIFRRNDKIVHKFNGKEIEIDFDKWRDAVVSFSDSVLAFYESSTPRKFYADEDEKDFNFFMSEFKRLRKEAFE